MSQQERDIDRVGKALVRSLLNSESVLDWKITTLGKASGLDIDTLTSMFMAGYTLKAPPNQSMKDVAAEYARHVTAGIRAVIGPQATCATCALARPCGDDNSRLCGTDNIIRGVDFYCSNAIRRKDGNDD